MLILTYSAEPQSKKVFWMSNTILKQNIVLSKTENFSTFSINKMSDITEFPRLVMANHLL